MPASPQWFLQLPKIIEKLKGVSVPVIDRAVVEKLFNVGRRRAIQLMHSFDGYQIGKTFVVERLALIAKLETMRRGDPFEYELRRKTKVIEELERTRKLLPGRKVRIPVAPDVRDRVMTDLPPGIKLRPGELRIEFFGTEDLLRHLFELSQAILNDYKRFESIIEETIR